MIYFHAGYYIPEGGAPPEPTPRYAPAGTWLVEWDEGATPSKYEDVYFPVIVVTPPAGTGSSVKVFNGTVWQLKPLKRWNGSTWTTATLKRWNGASWVTV